VRGPATLLVVAIVAAVGQRLFWSSFFSVVAGLAEQGEDGRHADRRFAVAGMIQMGATGVGALLGGLAVTYSWYRPVVYLNAASFLVSALLLLFVPRDAAPAAGEQERGGYGTLLRDRPYLLLIAVNTIFALCSIFVGVAVPVYLVDGLPAPHWLVGPLLAANTVLLASGQRLAVRLVRPLSRAQSLALAGGFWVVWAVVYAAAVRVPGWALVPYLLVGMLPFAAADLIHAPISNALSAAAGPGLGRRPRLRGPPAACRRGGASVRRPGRRTECLRRPGSAAASAHRSRARTGRRAARRGQPGTARTRTRSAGGRDRR
jgi:hypothetical protein